MYRSPHSPAISRGKTAGHAHAAVEPKKSRAAMKEWNYHLTDGSQYKLTPDERLRRKKLMVSKHNIFLQDNEPSIGGSVSKLSKSNKSDTVGGDVTSLDLLTSSSSNFNDVTNELEVTKKLFQANSPNKRESRDKVAKKLRFQSKGGGRVSMKSTTKKGGAYSYEEEEEEEDEDDHDGDGDDIVRNDDENSINSDDRSLLEPVTEGNETTDLDDSGGEFGAFYGLDGDDSDTEKENNFQNENTTLQGIVTPHKLSFSNPTSVDNSSIQGQKKSHSYSPSSSNTTQAIHMSVSTRHRMWKRSNISKPGQRGLHLGTPTTPKTKFQLSSPSTPSGVPKSSSKNNNNSSSNSKKAIVPDAGFASGSGSGSGPGSGSGSKPVDDDWTSIAMEINGLHGELKYYEQLTGKRSILDHEELDAILPSISAPGATQKTVIRYLVQLVCQSMTYLLKSEVDLQNQKSKYDILSSRLDSLTALMNAQFGGIGLGVGLGVGVGGPSAASSAATTTPPTTTATTTERMKVKRSGLEASASASSTPTPGAWEQSQSASGGSASLWESRYLPDGHNASAEWTPTAEDTRIYTTNESHSTPSSEKLRGNTNTTISVTPNTRNIHVSSANHGNQSMTNQLETDESSIQLLKISMNDASADSFDRSGSYEFDRRSAERNLSVNLTHDVQMQSRPHSYRDIGIGDIVSSADSQVGGGTATDDYYSPIAPDYENSTTINATPSNPIKTRAGLEHHSNSNLISNSNLNSKSNIQQQGPVQALSPLDEMPRGVYSTVDRLAAGSYSGASPDADPELFNNTHNQNLGVNNARKGPSIAPGYMTPHTLFTGTSTSDWLFVKSPTAPPRPTRANPNSNYTNQGQSFPLGGGRGRDVDVDVHGTPEYAPTNMTPPPYDTPLATTNNFDRKSTPVKNKVPSSQGQTVHFKDRQSPGGGGQGGKGAHLRDSSSSSSSSSSTSIIHPQHPSSAPAPQQAPQHPYYRQQQKVFDARQGYF